MHIQFITTILGWLGITSAVVAGGSKVALAAKVAAAAAKVAVTKAGVIIQSIPSYTFYEWMWNIGSIGYGVGGVYEGYKVAKNVPDDDNTPLFPVIPT